MINEENVPMFSELPMDNPDAAKPEEVSVNNLQDNLLFLMDRDKVSLAEVQRETMIPWTTVYGWYRGSVKAQLLDINVKELADYFDVTVDQLAFGNLRNACSVSQDR